MRATRFSPGRAPERDRQTPVFCAIASIAREPLTGAGSDWNFSHRYRSTRLPVQSVADPDEHVLMAGPVPPDGLF